MDQIKSMPCESCKTLDKCRAARACQDQQASAVRLYNLKEAEELAPGVRPLVLKEPMTGKWYVGVHQASVTAPLMYGYTARYEGNGFWYCPTIPTNSDVAMRRYDYLQELE